MNCLADWCTEVVQFCMAKSKYKDSPLMTSPSVGNVGGCAWCDDLFRGNNHDGGGLTGGGMDNAPQPKLPLTKYNLSRYVAFFPD